MTSFSTAVEIYSVERLAPEDRAAMQAMGREPLNASMLHVLSRASLGRLDAVVEGARQEPPNLPVLGAVAGIAIARAVAIDNRTASARLFSEGLAAKALVPSEES